VLFWNLNGKNVVAMIVDLVLERDIDLIVLAEEEGLRNTQFVESLCRQSESLFTFHDSLAQKRLCVFSRFPPGSVTNLEDSHGIAVRRLKPPDCLPMIMVAVHLPSQMYWSRPEDRLALCREVRESLEHAEFMEHHERSFVVGDFNSNPFAEEIVSSEGLHAVSSFQVAARSSRKVYKKNRRFLYNPMWSLLGDHPQPPGSFYYAVSTPGCPFWHLFDQVLMRPEMARVFDFNKLNVVTDVGENQLLTPLGQPDTNRYSDHLPLIFSFDVMEAYSNE